ncbi:MAG: APC family permease [Chloroflexota bacterium]
MSIVNNQNGEGKVVLAEIGKLKREVTLLPLFGLIYFTVCGGAFGAEAIIGFSGPGLAIALFFLVPLVYSIPNMLMVRELQSMMPGEGGYYHWVKQAFGPFAGFMAGWMNWVVSWVDVSIYPVLAAYYIGYFFPAIREGLQIGNLFIDSNILSLIIALILIWSISYLNVRGARIAGLVTNWLGIFMVIPLIIISILGIYQWIRGGVTVSLPFIPEGQNIFGALSTGIFVAMWNFMGWELPSAAGDEIVNPRRTYPMAMLLVLIAAIATYLLPTLAGLYGGAGEDGKYQLWGIEESASGEGIAPAMEDYGISADKLQSWGVDPTSSVGWEFNDIAHAIGEKISGKDSPLPWILGGMVTISAVLGMIGLFIGNSLGGTRVPFAMAEDGMMPRWMVKVHGRYGTPWVSIVFCAILYSIFSYSAFAVLVVIDVFMNVVVLLMQFLALWKLRLARPDIKRWKIPGGWAGLTIITLGPFLIFFLAVYSQFQEEGFNSLGLALVAIVVGMLVYFPVRRYIKPGVPDIDPFELETETD